MFVRDGMFLAGVDGCRAGWVAFKVELPSLATSLDLVDLPKLLRSRTAPGDVYSAQPNQKDEDISVLLSRGGALFLFVK
jgi:hypothetical protein